MTHVVRKEKELGLVQYSGPGTRLQARYEDSTASRSSEDATGSAESGVVLALLNGPQTASTLRGAALRHQGGLIDSIAIRRSMVVLRLADAVTAAMWWRRSEWKQSGRVATISTPRTQAIDVLCRAVSCDYSLYAVPELFTSIKRASGYRPICVMSCSAAKSRKSDTPKKAVSNTLATNPLNAMETVIRLRKRGASLEVNKLPTSRPNAIEFWLNLEQQVVG